MMLSPLLKYLFFTPVILLKFIEIDLNLAHKLNFALMLKGEKD